MILNCSCIVIVIVVAAIVVAGSATAMMWISAITVWNCYMFVLNVIKNFTIVLILQFYSYLLF